MARSHFIHPATNPAAGFACGWFSQFNGLVARRRGAGAPIMRFVFVVVADAFDAGQRVARVWFRIRVQASC